MSGSIVLMVAYLINIVTVLSLIFIERKDIDSTWAWLLVISFFLINLEPIPSTNILTSIPSSTFFLSSFIIKLPSSSNLNM